jgi:hypothetical protein
VKEWKNSQKERTKADAAYIALFWSYTSVYDSHFHHLRLLLLIHPEREREKEKVKIKNKSSS